MRKVVFVALSFFSTFIYAGSNDVDLLDEPDIVRQVAQYARASLEYEPDVVYNAASMEYFTSIQTLLKILTDTDTQQSLIDLKSDLTTSIQVQESIQEPQAPFQEAPQEEILPDIWAQEKLKIAAFDQEVIEVSDNPGHNIDEARTAGMQGKFIKVSDSFNPGDYVQRGGDGACQFLSSLASIMSLEKGRQEIAKLIKAQDENYVYFQFHAFKNPAPANKKFNDALLKIYKVPRKFITTYGSYPSASPDWLHLLMRAYYFLIATNRGLDIMAPNGVLQVERANKFNEVWSQVPSLDNRQEAFSPLVGKRLTSLSYLEWGQRKAEAVFSNLKNQFTGAAQNVMNFFRHGHALSMVKTDKGVAAYDNLNGKPDTPIDENQDNQSFMDAVFAKIKAWGGSVLSYFTDPL